METLEQQTTQSEPETRLAQIRFASSEYDAEADSAYLVVEEVDIKPGDVFVLTRDFIEDPSVFGRSDASIVANAILQVGAMLNDRLDRLTKSTESLRKTVSKKS